MLSSERYFSKRLLTCLLLVSVLLSFCVSPVFAQDKDDPDIQFISKVCEKLDEQFYEPTQLRYSKLFNESLRDVADLLRQKNIKFRPKKIQYYVSKNKAEKKFQEEFLRAKRMASLSLEFGADDLVFSAANALLRAVGNSHTYFLNPKESEWMNGGEDIDNLAAIGCKIKRLEDDFFYINHIISGSPSEKALLQRFDRLISIDGKKVENNLEKIVSQLRGKKDTEVEVIVERSGKGISIKAKRDFVGLPSAEHRILNDQVHNFYYLLLCNFDLRGTEEIIDCLKEILESKPEGLIIDLRGNSGGNFATFNLVLDYFFKAETHVYTVKNWRTTIEYKTSVMTSSLPATSAIFCPIVILIDEESGSAAEMLPAILQEQGKATVIGEKGSGTVSVGRLLRVDRKANMCVTAYQFSTVKGKIFEGLGVMPDIQVLLTKDDILCGRDAQLERAMKYLKEEIENDD